MDDRLIGKTLRGVNRSTELDKLAAAHSFIEGLSSVSTVVATVRVSQPYYVPTALKSTHPDYPDAIHRQHVASGVDGGSA